MLLPPAEPVAKEYSVGWMVTARTDFLWWVSVTIVLPAAKSHSLQVKHQTASPTERITVCYYSPHSGVHAASDDLRVRVLAFDIRDGRCVS